MSMSTRSGIAALVPVLLIALSACGSETSTPTPTPLPDSPGPTTEPPPELSEQEKLEAEWDALVLRAQEEGEIVVIGMDVDDLPIMDIFTEKYGIEILSQLGSSSPQVDRVLAERQRGRYEADFAMTGGSSSRRLIRAGALAPVAPYLSHPEVVDRSGWITGDRIPYTDFTGKYTHGTSVEFASNLGNIFYNTEAVTPEEIDSIQSWYDFLKPEWIGRLGASYVDPNSDKTRHLGVWLATGPDWFEPLYTQMDVKWYGPNSDREIADALARKIVDMVVLGGSQEMLIMEQLGLPLKLLDRTLEEGTFVLLSGHLAVFDQPPHPNAAELLLNWRLSQEGMALWNAIAGRLDRPSLRTDVPRGTINEQAWARFQTVDPDVIVNEGSEEYLVRVREANAFLLELYQEHSLFGY